LPDQILVNDYVGDCRQRRPRYVLSGFEALRVGELLEVEDVARMSVQVGPQLTSICRKEASSSSATITAETTK